MRIVPESDTVLCEQVSSKGNAVENGIVYEKDCLPVYKIISAGAGVKSFAVGDEIICDSTGTKLNVDEKTVQYLFNEEHIVCKVL